MSRDKGQPVLGEDGTLVHRYSHRAAAQPEDSREGLWSRERLKRMDQKFQTAMRRELSRRDDISLPPTQESRERK
jgi:hypothetical protein